MSGVVRVGCSCGAATFSQATAALPRSCSFCGRPLEDSAAARLRALRLAHRLSTRAVATQLGIARTTAYEWETGHRPIPAQRRTALAALFDIAPDLLATDVAYLPAAQPAMTAPSSLPSSGSTEPRDASATTSTPASAQAQPPGEPSPRSTMRVTIELSCLLCGREVGVLECDAWPTYGVVLLRRVGVPPGVTTDWRCLRCATCGGTAIPGEVTHRLIRSEAALDWSSERPRRGRPPRWLVAQRQAARDA